MADLNFDPLTHFESNGVSQIKLMVWTLDMFNETFVFYWKGIVSLNLNVLYYSYVKQWSSNLSFLVANYKPTGACDLTKTIVFTKVLVLVGVNVS